MCWRARPPGEVIRLDTARLKQDAKFDVKPELQPAASNQRSSASRLKSVLRAALAMTGLLTALAGLALTGLAAREVWVSEKAAGEVSEVIAGVGGGSAPVVVFNDGAGKRQQFTGPLTQDSTRYEPGSSVTILYDPRDPFSVRLFDAVTHYAPGLALVGAGALALLIAASLAPTMGGAPARPRPAHRPRAPSDPADEAQRYQFHPLNAVAAAHYVAEFEAPAAARKVKITDAAKALSQERIPVVLAEVLAHAAAIAYAADPVAYITAHCPRFTSARLATHDGARALLFTFEGHGVAVFAAPALSGLVTGLAQLLTPTAGARQYVPEDTVWDATPRLRAPARAFDALRGDLEQWAATFALRPEDQPPFLLAGHAFGGALAQLAAYEFVKRGRQIAAVVTFGAPSAGGEAFRDEYASLGLDERTLACGAPLEALPVMQGPFASLPPGTLWRLAPVALKADETGAAPPTAKGIAATALAAAIEADLSSGAHKQSLAQRLKLRFFSSAPAARDALLAYDLQRRYVLPICVLVDRRVKEVLAQKGSDKDLAAAKAALQRHRQTLRAAADEEALGGPFEHLDRLMPRVAEQAAADEPAASVTANA